MENHNGTIIKTSENFFKKNTSHFICKVACERELETEQRLQHIDLPSTSGIAVCRFRSPGLLSLGPSLSGTRYHSSIFSLTHLISNSQSGIPRAPYAGWWLSLPHLVSNLSDFQLNRRSKRSLLPGGGFPYHILPPTRLVSNSLTSCLYRVI